MAGDKSATARARLAAARHRGRRLPATHPVTKIAGAAKLAHAMEPGPERRRAREVREWATLGVAALGLTGVLISLFSLKQSSDSSARQDQRTRYQTISERLLDMDAALVQHPDLTPYFRDGQKLDNHVDPRTRQTVVALAAERADYDEYAYNQLVDLGIAPPSRHFVLRSPNGPPTVYDDWLAWSETIKEDFHDSPPMCDVVRDAEHTKGYGAAFITALATAGVCPGLSGYANW